MSLFEDVREVRRQVDQLRLDVDRHEEQISGKRGLSSSIEDLAKGVREMHDEFRRSRQGLTKGERIALFGSCAGFLGALAAAIAVLSGGG